MNGNIYYMGRPIEELTKEELIEAVEHKFYLDEQKEKRDREIEELNGLCSAKELGVFLKRYPE